MKHLSQGGSPVLDDDEHSEDDMPTVRGVWSDVPPAPDAPAAKAGAARPAPRALRAPPLPKPARLPPRLDAPRPLPIGAMPPVKKAFPKPHVPPPSDEAETLVDEPSDATEDETQSVDRMSVDSMDLVPVSGEHAYGRDSIESMPPEMLESIESIPPAEPQGPPRTVPRSSPPPVHAKDDAFAASVEPPSIEPRSIEPRSIEPRAAMRPAAVQAAPSQPTRGPRMSEGAPPPLTLDSPLLAPIQKKATEEKKNGWVVPTVGFALGVAATIVVGWLVLRDRLQSTDNDPSMNTVATHAVDELPAEPAHVNEVVIEPQAVDVDTSGVDTSGVETTDVEAAAVLAPQVSAEPTTVQRPEPERRVDRAEPREPRVARTEPAVAPRPRPAPVEDDEDEDEPAPVATPAPRPRPVASGDLPALPSRDDVAAAIQSIRSDLLACAPDSRGHVANIRFTFASSGRATSALVPTDFNAAPAARSCVATAARRARVPAFSEPRLVVTYPVQF
ncbi:MAG: hypothetical protein AB7S26_20375 [Sandaracinaceae bacterium]